MCSLGAFLSHLALVHSKWSVWIFTNFKFSFTPNDVSETIILSNWEVTIKKSEQGHELSGWWTSFMEGILWCILDHKGRVCDFFQFAVNTGKYWGFLPGLYLAPVLICIQNPVASFVFPRYRAWAKSYQKPCPVWTSWADLAEIHRVEWMGGGKKVKLGGLLAEKEKESEKKRGWNVCLPDCS